MYTLESLQQKNLKELKEIGFELNILPDGDRRCRQNWIDALISVQPPLLQLLEVSPGVEPVEDAIEVQAQEPPIESNFGCIVYPKPAVKLIAQNAETRPQLDRTESADVHNWRSHPAESVRDSSGAKAEALGSKEGDRVLALAGNSEASRRGFLPHQSIELAATFNDEQPPNRGDGKGRIEPKVSQSAIVPAAKNHLDIEKVDPNPILTGVTFSERFLARYSPPQPESIRFHADSEGQLNLLDFEVPVVDEPPDPDDFESLDAFREAIALWDAEHPEPLEISLDSFCEWAPCPDDWYEPDTLLKPSEVLEHSPAIESSSTCNFSIPTFDAWCDRAARQTDSDEPPNPEDFDSMFAFWAAYDAWVGEDDTDEPPDTGIFAKLPGPKPPKFPPRAIGSDTAKKSLNANRHTTRSPIAAQAHITHIAAGSSSQSGRSPPGGDAMH